jgi:arylsulfatase A-like enzyme
MAPPNIVFILADDLGYADVSCYGRRDFETPSIDRIAAEGLRFEQAYANSSVCTASRVALMTGRYQYRLPIGLEEPLRSTSERTVGLPSEHPSLPSLLKTAGYQTALVGTWHLGRPPAFGPRLSGYDRFFGFHSGVLDYFTHKFGPPHTDTEDLWEDDQKVRVPGYLTDVLSDRAVATIGEFANAGRPFFLSLHFNAPHWPWEGPEDEAGALRLKSLFHFDGGTQRTYQLMVQRMDLQIGRVLQALEAAGVADNTVVIFTSDNGGERFSDTWPFTGKKTELLEGGLRIPAVIRWPARIKASQVSQQVMIHMDWIATLLAAAGVAPDPDFPSDGIDLMPCLTEEAAPAPRTLFWRYKYMGQEAARDGDWKYLKILGNTFLFDVVKDPLERANLKDRYPDVYARLVAAWHRWNETMLPLDPNSYTLGFSGAELADHFGAPTAPHS